MGTFYLLASFFGPFRRVMLLKWRQKGRQWKMLPRMQVCVPPRHILGEIIVRLTMKYNRTRQAVITNELVDIITGASAL